MAKSIDRQKGRLSCEKRFTLRSPKLAPRSTNFPDVAKNQKKSGAQLWSRVTRDEPTKRPQNARLAFKFFPFSTCPWSARTNRSKHYTSNELSFGSLRFGFTDIRNGDGHVSAALKTEAAGEGGEGSAQTT